MYIGAWNVAWLIIYFIHIILFYPGWVFVYNEWPLSNVYKNQLDLYSYSLFYLTCFLIIILSVLPIMVVKQTKSIFFPNLIDLVRVNKFDKTIDIEDKLRIDMVKLAKDLDSDEDDQSVRMSQGTAHRVKISQPASHETFIVKNANSEQSELQSMNDEDSGLERDDISSIAAGSGINESEEESKTSNSISNAKSQGSFKNGGNRFTNSFQKLAKSNTSKTPAFEKFSGNIQEFKVSSETTTGSGKRKPYNMKRSRTKRGKKINENLKFHPHKSSVRDETIHEKSDEDNEEASNYSKGKKVEENKHDSDSSNSEGSYEESHNAYSLDANSAIIGKSGMHNKSNIYSERTEVNHAPTTIEPKNLNDLESESI